MNRKTLSTKVLGVTLIALLLVGCGASEATPTLIPSTNTPTPVPPTATPTAIPPTATPTTVPPTATPTAERPTTVPTPSFTLAKSADEILGTWQAGRDYTRFDNDGTFRQANALDKLDDRPYAISSYQFEGTELVTMAISVSGVPSCGDAIGRYEIQLLENGNIKIVDIEDKCRPRAGDLAGLYEPVR